MENLRLIKPNENYLKEIEDYKLEMLTNNSSMDGTGSLRKCKDAKEWLANNLLYENKDTVPNNRCVASQYIYLRVSDNKIVGMIQIRHYFNDYLKEYGGHIGYCVRPSERRKGYAKSMLKEALKICKEELGLTRVLITCLDGNLASQKTIMANGGVYERSTYEPVEKITLQRYWIELGGRK